MSGTDEQEMEIKRYMETERQRQALADYLQIDPKEISVCSTRIDNLPTFQARKMLYLLGTEEEVNAGIRGYFRNNLGNLDSAFIGSIAKLSDGDAAVVDRLCEIMDEDIETEILNEALLSIVGKCGDLDALIDAAAAEVDRGEFLAIDGKENPFGEYLIYKFKEGQCSDFDY
jgi:2C-methyl-D-erythritol 2,4-cyclodiphosphate synthase